MKEHKNGIAERALLVDLSLSAWKGQKTDRNASGEVCENKHAQPDAAKVVKNIVSSHIFKEVNRIHRDARNLFYGYTHPWLDSGVRLLPAELYFKFEETLKRLKEEHGKAIEALGEAYENEIVNARVRMGELFDSSEYPSIDSFKFKFGLGWSYLPFPKAQHFAEAAAQADAKDLEERFEAEKRDRLNEVVASLGRRITTVVSEFASRIDPSKPRFWDSVADEVRELAGIIDGLNITGDEKIAEIGKELRKLAKVQVQDIRDDKKARSEAIAKADEIRRKATSIGKYL